MARKPWTTGRTATTLNEHAASGAAANAASGAITAFAACGGLPLVGIAASGAITVFAARGGLPSVGIAAPGAKRTRSSDAEEPAVGGQLG